MGAQYSVVATLAEEMTGTILWDTGEATPLYAEEEFFIEVESSSSAGAGSVATVIIVKVNDIPLDNVAVYVTTDIYMETT